MLSDPLVHIGFHKTGSTWLQHVLFTPDSDCFFPLAPDRSVDQRKYLGKRFVRQLLQGANLPEPDRYPRTIRRWINLVAVGELTATERCLARRFASMARGGFIDSIEDYDVFNYFRSDGVLNVHTEYGYLVNEQCGSLIAEWWKSQLPAA